MSEPTSSRSQIALIEGSVLSTRHGLSFFKLHNRFKVAAESIQKGYSASQLSSHLGQFPIQADGHVCLTEDTSRSQGACGNKRAPDSILSSEDTAHHADWRALRVPLA